MSTTAGDIDGDALIGLADVDQLVAVLLGGSCSPTCLAKCDINGDGAINGVDIVFLTRLLSGW